MPDLSRIPEVQYDPLNSYHYSFDNAPLKAILQRIELVNSVADQTAATVKAAVGTAGTLENRLSQALEPSGRLKTAAVDGSLHSIESHTDSTDYVRMRAAERAKLTTVADNATNLALRVISGFQNTYINSGTLVLQATPGVQWGVQGAQNTTNLRCNLTFLGAIHRHFYDQPAIQQFQPPDYQSYQTAADPIPFKDGSLRVMVNGYELTTDPAHGVYVPVGANKTPTLLWFTPTYGRGRFSLNQPVTSYDTVRIDFDTTVGSNDQGGGLVAPGAQGPQGFQGTPGLQGDIGRQGAIGMGAQGDRGSQGFQGEPGTGTQGRQGAQGAQGFGANYSNPNPLPVGIGGFQAGMVLNNLTMQQMWDLLLFPYMTPAFSTFSIQNVGPVVEVGDTIQGQHTFLWTDTNPTNIQANTIAIYDTSNSRTLRTGLGDTGSVAITLPNPVFYNALGSNIWTIQATNTQAQTFSKTYTVNWQWRVYWGVNALTSLVPVMVTGLASSQVKGVSTGSYAFGTTGYKYFCCPADYPAPTAFTDASNGFQIAMADNTDDPAIDQQTNGYWHQLLTVTNQFGIDTNYRVYRTKNVLGGTITFQVS